MKYCAQGLTATPTPFVLLCCPAGSDGARLHVEGVRARVVTTAAAAAKAKFGTTEAEFTAVAELLGTDADDEDFCPTCLEAYTDGGSSIHGSTGACLSFYVMCVGYSSRGSAAATPTPLYWQAGRQQAAMYCLCDHPDCCWAK